MAGARVHVGGAGGAHRRGCALFSARTGVRAQAVTISRCFGLGQRSCGEYGLSATNSNSGPSRDLG